MTERYDPGTVEAKWQQRWEDSELYHVDINGAANPFYNLMMYPYPSAEGLHVGNVYAFTGADIHGRFKQLQGNDVFEPIGFDAFGIHSENFALEQGVHPMELIPRNIANFTRQLKRMGFMYDWYRVVDVTQPDYYKWTQWIFLQLFKARLAERRKAPVNWCPSCKTVLANEQVIDSRCERCSTEVTQRYLDQWFFKITDFVERLLDNLEWIDWSESTKRLQRNWIGRSEGADIDFEVAGHPEEKIRVFTTRPDTLFGATFMVLAPEHPLVKVIISKKQRGTVEKYVKNALAMDLVERRKAGEERQKTGVDTGAKAINPATGEEISIWVADYVLMEYGHGAIMAVPAHDERDFEFAKQYDLPIRIVVVPAGQFDGFDPKAELEEAFTEHTEDEVLVNSGKFDGMPAAQAIKQITQWLEQEGRGTGTVNYRIHDWCISRQRYWGPPIPIIHCEECGIVPVPEKDLPVLLPYVENFKPDESGVGPLARSKDFLEVECPECGGPAQRETDVSDTFLDSAWYFMRYPSTDKQDVPFDAERTAKWLPVDAYIGGEEHAVLHLMYSRFITMALYDLGHLPFEEPYKQFRKHGLIVREGAKMSKSRGNVVIPDEYVEKYGADTFRTYLMFLGPYEEGGDFRDQGITGISRFFDRIWDAATSDDLRDGPPETDELKQKLHATIKKVTRDVSTLQYNTAIAAMMEYLNAIRAGGRTLRRSEIEPLVVMTAPFAPHLAEELWEHLGHDGSIFSGANWPQYDPQLAIADEVDIAVQVNGRFRATVKAARGAGEDEVKRKALADEAVQRHVDGKEIRKIIFVPDRLLNIVVG
ncbi:MAG: leucine--tRNA ligase [Gemmatimonas sp. SG8_38_2]|nr:MAG: leucine--tRNA ligase [Gemmatimonas sp. SG8_38_2]